MCRIELERVVANKKGRPNGLPKYYSHSIVAGGFELMS